MDGGWTGVGRADTDANLCGSAALGAPGIGVTHHPHLSESVIRYSHTPRNRPSSSSSGVFQQGPWQGKRFEVSSEWLLQALRAKIESVDWKLARDDVRRFLPPSEQRGLDSWTAGLFLHQVERMAAYLAV